MVLAVQLEVRGRSEALQMIEGLGRNARNFRPLFRGIDKSVRRYFRRQFSKQGVGPAGPWAQLSKNYKSYKRKRYGRRKILAATGKMRRALVMKSAHNQYVHIGKNAYARGTFNLDYPSYHDSGTTKMPRRIVVDLDSEFRADYKKEVIWHGRKAVIRARRRYGRK